MLMLRLFKFYSPYPSPPSPNLCASYRGAADDTLLQSLDVEGCEALAPQFYAALPPELILVYQQVSRGGGEATHPYYKMKTILPYTCYQLHYVII